MALRIPPAVNYPSPLRDIPSLSQDEPREGRKQISAEIEWGTMGGPSQCVAFNLGSGNLPLRQISTLKVDNSACGVDVQFIFPDATDTITIPAGSPATVVPVFSNSLTFFVVGLGGLPSDVTRFLVLNYATSPADVSRGEDVSPSNAAGVVLDGPAPKTITTQLIPAGVDGTLEILLLSRSPNNPTFAGNNPAAFEVRDGAGNVLFTNWRFNITGAGSPSASGEVFSQSNLNWRFNDGLIVEFEALSGWGAAASIYGNYFATYRQP